MNKKKIIQGGPIVMATGAVVKVCVLTAGLGLLYLIGGGHLQHYRGAEVRTRIRRRSFREESL